MRYKPEPNRLEEMQKRSFKRVALKKRKSKESKERTARLDEAESERLAAKKNVFVRMPRPKEFAEKWYARFGEWPKNYKPEIERYLLPDEDGYIL